MSELVKTIEAIEAQNNSDVFIFSSTIMDSKADEFIKLLRDKPDKKENCSLILTTNGGDPDAGYRLIRAIRRYYKTFFLYVFGRCKSTGTLIALGADEIIMSDFGEFGPLDIQLTKDDEMSNTSGLSYLQSLSSLNDQIFRSFEDNFLSLKRRSGYTITTKTAADIGAKLAIGLISPISGQLDPVKLGEVQRAIKIADAYGKRVCEDPAIIAKLIAGYPSHGFVIDHEEAKKIFKSVRFVNQAEAIFERHLFHLVRSESRESMITDLSQIAANENDKKVADSEPEQQVNEEAINGQKEESTVQEHEAVEVNNDKGETVKQESKSTTKKGQNGVK